MYSHHFDNRPMGMMIEASNRMVGQSDRIGWTRLIAVRTIKLALRELVPIETTYKNGRRVRRERWARDREEAMAWFQSSPDFEVIAACTSYGANVWREAARAIYTGEVVPRWNNED